jgi:hypothetical protein
MVSSLPSADAGLRGLQLKKQPYHRKQMAVSRKREALPRKGRAILLKCNKSRQRTAFMHEIWRIFFFHVGA